MGIVSQQTGTDTDIEHFIHCSVTMSASVVNTAINTSEELFPSSLLDDLKIENYQASFNNPFNVRNPGPGLTVRSLNIGDYDRGFLELLGQLTSVGKITREAWNQRWKDMKNCNSTYYVIVIEDITMPGGLVIGAATMVMERKFIHSCGSVGRLEDVVVSDQYRGKQLGKLVVCLASELAVKLGCYKVTLNCADKMIKFYTSLGYKSEMGNNNYMCIRVESAKARLEQQA